MGATKSRLDRELRRLQTLTGYGQELRVEWVPDGHGRSPIDGKPISGEVRGNTILIYDKDETPALNTLKHEFLDYVLSLEVEAPYKDLINRLVSVFEAECYRRKERLVNKLTQIL